MSACHFCSCLKILWRLPDPTLYRGRKDYSFQAPHQHVTESVDFLSLGMDRSHREQNPKFQSWKWLSVAASILAAYPLSLRSTRVPYPNLWKLPRGWLNDHWIRSGPLPGIAQCPLSSQVIPPWVGRSQILQGQHYLIKIQKVLERETEPQRVPEQRLITPCLRISFDVLWDSPLLLFKDRMPWKLESGQDTAHALLRTQLSWASSHFLTLWKWAKPTESGQVVLFKACESKTGKRKTKPQWFRGVVSKKWILCFG